MFRIFHNYLEEKDSPRRRAFRRKDQDQRSEPRRNGEHGEGHRYKRSKPENYRTWKTREEHFEEKIKVKDLNPEKRRARRRASILKVKT